MDDMSQARYFEASRDWTYDIYLSKSLWLRRSFFIVILLSVLLVGSLLLNLFLFPLKEKVPYLYAFDHSTGEITKIGTLDSTILSSNWELTRYLLIRYVIQAESYSYDNIDQPYQMVWAQSAGDVRVEYESSMNSNNPHSPYRIYGKDKYLTTKVISVNRLSENTVDVKFIKTLHDRATNGVQDMQKEAIMKWSYDGASTSQTMLDRDPLGFKVNYYQVTQVSTD